MSGPVRDDRDRVSAFAHERFGPGASLEPLAGDASDRAFFRLKAPSLSPLILMVHREPFDLETLPFFLHARFLHEIGAAVPQIVASYPSEGILVVQDLGDDVMQAHLARCDASRRRFLYLQSVQIIAFLQGEATRSLPRDLPAATTALDRERLLWELRFFAEHYVRGLMGSPLGEEQGERLDEWFDWLASQVAGYRSVLCHRDFHSRNLMLKGDRLFMIDFQDARMGPYTYDLASLLRDSYVDLPEELVAEMIEFYREATRCPEAPDELGTSFARTCLQRNIKALGTFASQATLRGNGGYLKYVPRTLSHVRANLEREAASGEGAATGILELFTGPLDYR
ncbi:MAG TPA: phosphotransferase [Candidatus Polarisedimenticolia bacterium]|jgi:hypothetical protein